LHAPFALAIACFTFSGGLARIAEMLNTRDERMIPIGLSRLAIVFSSSLVLAAMWASGDRAIARFIWAQVAMQLLIAGAYFLQAGWRYLRPWPTQADLVASLRSHRKFPLLVMPSDFVNAAAYNVPVILIERYFGAALAAQYAIVLKFCDAPLSLLGNSIGRVYHGELAGAVRAHEPGTYARFKRFRRAQAFASLAVGLSICAFFPPLITLLLGPNWEVGASFARWLAPAFALAMLATPLSMVFFVFERQGFLLGVQLAYLAISLGSFGLAIACHDLWIGIVAFSSLSALRYGAIIWTINADAREHLEALG